MARVIGVLGLQGGFDAHVVALRECGFVARTVTDVVDFSGIDGLVLPGGESTVQLRLLERNHLVETLRAFVMSGAPILATCAGLILAARGVEHPAQKSFGFLDVDVSRNAWGRQLDSFEATSDDGATPLVFIRAPRILRAGAEVQVLARFDGEPIFVRQNNRFGATFHPELTGDRKIHRSVFS